MVQLNFDATKVAPDTGFDVVPAGWYNAMVDESELRPTKDGTGAYLNLRFEVVDGQYKGRKIFSRFNIKNANPQAQEIAHKQLSAVCHAVGVLDLQNSEMLHNRPMKIKVRIKKDKEGQYDDQNEITSYKNVNEQVDMAGATPGPSASMFNVPPVAKPIPATVAIAPEYEMAQGEQYTREQYKAAGWSDEALVQAGKMKLKAPVSVGAGGAAQPWQQPAAQLAGPLAPAPAAQAPQPAPAAPATAPSAPAAQATPAAPPWAKPPAG